VGRDELANVVEVRQRAFRDQVHRYGAAVVAGGNEDDDRLFGVRRDCGMGWLRHCFVQRRGEQRRKGLRGDGERLVPVDWPETEKRRIVNLEPGRQIRRVVQRSRRSNEADRKPVTPEPKDRYRQLTVCIQYVQVLEDHQLESAQGGDSLTARGEGIEDDCGGGYSDGPSRSCLEDFIVLTKFQTQPERMRWVTKLSREFGYKASPWTDYQHPSVGVFVEGLPV